MPLEQVFLYVTQKCNIRCVTCYALDQLERSDDLELADVLQMLRALRADGAWKLSFLGGEPTVYPGLGDVVVAAREIGFRFVRINTNGMFNASLLHRASMRGVDVWCFSIDGATAAVNDSIRKGARLDRVLANMRLARDLGYEVRANATITSKNIDQVFDIISIVQDVGGTEVNLNVLFLMGYALDRQDLSVSPAAWRRTYDEVVRRHKEFALRIKVPPAFAAPDELRQHREDGHRCLAADGTRSYVTSNGDMYPCLAVIDDPSHRVGTYAGGRMLKMAPKIAPLDAIHDYCHFIKMNTDGLQPLCIFHKQRLNAG